MPIIIKNKNEVKLNFKDSSIKQMHINVCKHIYIKNNICIFISINNLVKHRHSQLDVVKIHILFTHISLFLQSMKKVNLNVAVAVLCICIINFKYLKHKFLSIKLLHSVICEYCLQMPNKM